MGAADAAVRASSWLFWLLEFVGFVLLLSGAASMQKACGGSAANYLLSGGSAGYNAPVACDAFFRYLWWIVFFNLFVWILTAMCLGGMMHSFRPGIVALTAISVMQTCATANTYLYYNGLATTSSAFDSRWRVSVAGAIIKAIAGFILISLMGYRDETKPVAAPQPKPTKRKGSEGGGVFTGVRSPAPAGPECPPGMVPASTPCGTETGNGGTTSVLPGTTGVGSKPGPLGGTVPPV